MILLTAVTLGGLLLFSLARDFWSLLWLSLLTGATWRDPAALGEALALGEAKRRDVDYGRIRLWGSLTFILAAIAVGEWLERADPPIILWSVAAMVACLLAARTAAAWRVRRASCRGGRFAPPGAQARVPRLRRGRRPASGASHAVCGLRHPAPRAAGHGELVIGLLWAEGAIAEAVRSPARRRAAPVPRRSGCSPWPARSRSSAGRCRR